MLFEALIDDIRSCLSEVSLKSVQREINPLLSRRENPVKKVVSATERARETRAVQDIRRAIQAHGPASEFASEHGLPRLEKQLQRHKLAVQRLKPKQAPKQNKRGIGTKRSAGPRD